MLPRPLIGRQITVVAWERANNVYLLWWTIQILVFEVVIRLKANEFVRKYAFELKMKLKVNVNQTYYLLVIRGIQIFETPPAIGAELMLVHVQYGMSLVFKINFTLKTKAGEPLKR